MVMNLALAVEMTLLNRVLAASISAVGVATSPGQLILLLWTVNRVRLGSAILGLTVRTKLPYVTSLCRLRGTLLSQMN